MKAIIYTEESDAIAALAACSENIPEGEIRQVGEGPFINPDPGKPYTTIIKHPSDNKWALISDEHVENVLNEIGEELDSTWFPQSALLM